jgi:hypothetical protein
VVLLIVSQIWGSFDYAERKNNYSLYSLYGIIGYM